MIYYNIQHSGSLNVSGSIRLNNRAINAISAPTIGTINYSSGSLALDPAGGETLHITGSGFESGLNVRVDETNASSITRLSDTNLRITVPAKTAGDYDVNVTNPDGGTFTKQNAVSYNGLPTWNTSAGSIGSFYRLGSGFATISLSAGELDSGSVTYSLKSGTLPTGFSLTGSSGTINGNLFDPGAETTYNFTITATDDENQTTDRAFSITMRDLLTQTLTSSTTFIVPVGITSIQVELAAGGGGGGGGGSGGGCGYATGGSGAGGAVGAGSSYAGTGGSTGGNYTGGNGGVGGGSVYIASQNVSVTPGQSITVTVGAGGAGGLGGYYRGGTAGGSMGGRAGSAGSAGAQTSFGAISTSGTTGASGQTGTANNGGNYTFTEIINDQPEAYANYNGRKGGNGGDGAVRLTY